LMQSCSVYNRPANVDTALEAGKKVKVFTTGKQKYKFQRLEIKDDRLIGISRLGSSNSSDVTGLSTNIDGKFLVTDLSNVDIEKIMLRNDSASTNLSIIAVAATLVLGSLTFFIISFSKSDITIGSGSN